MLLDTDDYDAMAQSVLSAIENVRSVYRSAQSSMTQNQANADPTLHKLYEACDLLVKAEVAILAVRRLENEKADFAARSPILRSHSASLRKPR